MGRADPTDRAEDGRLLATLERLLSLRSIELRPALDDAATLLSEALQADKVDVFLFEPATDSLVALGTSRTRMGLRERELGLDRLPVSNGGRMVEVFQSGAPYKTGRADLDPGKLPGIVRDLGVRSELAWPIEVDGERRGVLTVVSSQHDAFTDRDERFVEAVSHWLSTIVHRAELVEQIAEEATRRGRRQIAEELRRLSPRQREVACLIAAGLSNEEIGERLVLTPGTVANHLENIRRKLELANRTQVAVWAVECGLYSSAHDDDRA